MFHDRELKTRPSPRAVLAMERSARRTTRRGRRWCPLPGCSYLFSSHLPPLVCPRQQRAGDCRSHCGCARTRVQSLPSALAARHPCSGGAHPGRPSLTGLHPAVVFKHICNETSYRLPNDQSKSQNKKPGFLCRDPGLEQSSVKVRLRATFSRNHLIGHLVLRDGSRISNSNGNHRRDAFEREPALRGQQAMVEVAEAVHGEFGR